MKKIIVLITTIFILFSCNHPKDEQIVKPKENPKTKTEVLKLTTSIIPLASIVNYIGGEYVEVKSLVPAGVSPHGFDLKPSQMITLEKSDLIVYLGLDHIDGFLDKALENKKNVLAVKKGIKFLESSEDEHEHEENHMEEGHEDKDHNDHVEEGHEDDPHIWGSAKNTYIIAKNILDKLVEIDVNHKEYFEQNLASLKDELDLAKNEFYTNTKNKTQTNFIVFHDAYNYLFEELDIKAKHKHVFRKNILSDPNSGEMKNLIDEIKSENIRVAYKEPQLDSKSLKNMASGYNFEILILDPLGKDESKNGYINNYKNNLKNLEKIYE